MKDYKLRGTRASRTCIYRLPQYPRRQHSPRGDKPCGETKKNHSLMCFDHFNSLLVDISHTVEAPKGNMHTPTMGRTHTETYQIDIA